MRVAEQREDELCQQITAIKTIAERTKRPAQETMIIQAFWGQPFSEEIDRTPISANFRELVVEPFEGTQDPHAHFEQNETIRSS
ncbi:hypothetical protein CR513_24188, partial [Mucuna pruriens]